MRKKVKIPLGVTFDRAPYKMVMTPFPLLTEGFVSWT